MLGELFVSGLQHIFNIFFPFVSPSDLILQWAADPRVDVVMEVREKSHIFETRMLEPSLA